MIDLQAFCEKPDGLRYYLQAPFAHRGYLYASNGHILVRVPAPEHAGTVCEHKPAEASVKMFAELQVGTYAAIPPLQVPRLCKPCKGAGHYLQTYCRTCQGEGEVHTRHGNYRECKPCAGTGNLATPDGDDQTCRACYGHGRESARLAIGAAVFEVNYLMMIKVLPDHKFAAGAFDKTAHFVFTGGEGLLMPMRIPAGVQA